MLFYTNLATYLRRIVTIVAVVLALTGCPSLTQHQVNDHDAKASSSYYLQQVEQSSGTEQVDWQFLAIRALLREGDQIKAAKLLKSLPNDLNQSQINEGYLAATEWQLAQQSPQNAAISLKKINPQTLNPQQQLRYYQLIADVAGLNNDRITQLRSFAALIPFSNTPDARQSLSDQVWSTLSSLSLQTLNNIVINVDEETLRGWLDLAGIYQTSKSGNLNLQTEFTIWQTRYPNNLLSQIVPSALTGATQPPTQVGEVKHIALLLPMDAQTKAFSEPIYAGFQTAMQLSGSTNVKLDLIDTTTKPVAEILQQLNQDPSIIVVGPLLKKEVEQASSANVSLNILALNKPESTEVKANMCYFGLSPEDEAKEAAHFIFNKQNVSPLLIVPRGSLGKRIAATFNTEWQTATGQTARVKYFDTYQDLKAAINSGAGMQLDGLPINAAIPVSTEAVDAVYIFSSQNELTLIKAMLDMTATSRNKAQLYASSRSNQANSGPDFRLEMDGLQFSEIPLLAGKNNELLQSTLKQFNNDYSQVRLFALGADAWQLANALTQIRTQSDYTVSGLTGTLNADNNCVINRQPTWLEFRQGRLNIIE